MSRLRPHTVKASLSNDEKKTIAAIAKRHEMSEAELIRFVLCNADDLDILVFRKSLGRNSEPMTFTSGSRRKKKRKSKAMLIPLA